MRFVSKLVRSHSSSLISIFPSLIVYWDGWRRRHRRCEKVREQNPRASAWKLDVSCRRSLSCRRLSLSEIGCKSFVIRVTTGWGGKRRGLDEVSRITCSEEKGGKFFWSYQRVNIHTQPDWQRDLTSISFALAVCSTQCQQQRAHCGDDDGGVEFSGEKECLLSFCVFPLRSRHAFTPCRRRDMSSFPSHWHHQKI